MPIQGDVRDAITSLPTSERVTLLTAALASLPPEVRRAVAEQAAAVPQPDNPTSNYLWRTVVTAFVAVFLLCAVSLVLGMFYTLGGPVKPELILSVITSLIGFLAGIFVPSPVGASGHGAGGK